VHDCRSAVGAREPVIAVAQRLPCRAHHRSADARARWRTRRRRVPCDQHHDDDDQQDNRDNQTAGSGGSAVSGRARPARRARPEAGSEHGSAWEPGLAHEAWRHAAGRVGPARKQHPARERRTRARPVKVVAGRRPAGEARPAASCCIRVHAMTVERGQHRGKRQRAQRQPSASAVASSFGVARFGGLIVKLGARRRPKMGAMPWALRRS
jgi:hypothetical protein